MPSANSGSVIDLIFGPVSTKYLPKSSANAVARVRPNASEMTFALNPAAKRSEKFCAYVPAMKVSATEYVSPVPSGLSSV